jgi:hypothetical protein
MRRTRRTPSSDRSEFVAAFTWLQDNKRFGVWIGCALVVATGLLRNWIPQLFPVAVFLYLGALTTIVLDIHRRSDVDRTIYPSHQEAASVFYEEIAGALNGRGGCNLAWIGVTLQSAWLTLENALGRGIADGQISKLNIRLLQSDPRYLKKLLGSTDSQAQLAKEQADHIVRFCERHEASLRATGSTIELAQYAYMPNYHGLLVNDERVYLATVRWWGSDFEELSVPHEPFERFDRSTPRGRYMIDLYSAWLGRGFATATVLHKFPREAKEEAATEIVEGAIGGR